ncbi:MAG: hypothetical protein R3313_04245 [Candidatus Saccharimonadales bacterium]|nr:hypothetical protein [Candidatus Saccharimonadales bacterium]
MHRPLTTQRLREFDRRALTISLVASTIIMGNVASLIANLS